MKNKLIVGTRSSKLALTQSESVVAQIKAANPGLEVYIIHITTSGDRNQRVPLGQTAGVGVFVKELEEALLEGRVDIAVHSLKDMPANLPEGLHLAATLERVYQGDVLVTRGPKLAELPEGAKIGTGSLRRAAEMVSFRPDLKMVSIRGNVDTRLGKALSGELDGVILAAAGLKRLGWEDKITEYLPMEHFMPAVGQGVIAIEARSADKETARIVAPLNHKPTQYIVAAERAFLRTLAGGCQAPIAALATVDGDTLKIDGMVIDVKTNKIIRGTETGKVTQAKSLGTKLAKKLLNAGADKLLPGDDYENW